MYFLTEDKVCSFHQLFKNFGDSENMGIILNDVLKLSGEIKGLTRDTTITVGRGGRERKEVEETARRS
jgi:hypothetical protein